MYLKNKKKHDLRRILEFNVPNLSDLCGASSITGIKLFHFYKTAPTFIIIFPKIKFVKYLQFDL